MNPPHPLEVLPADTFNQQLIAHAHPEDWVNPRPSGRYNLVVVGAGTAGLVAAAGAAALGARVALVERHLMGGDCLAYGCVPSKALIRAARAAHAVGEARQFGIESAPAKPDFAEVMRRVRRVRAEIAPHDSAKRFAGLGVDVFLGEAHFFDPKTVEVEGLRLEFRKAIIATGGHPATLSVPGLEQAGYLTNETVFSLTELPPRLIVVGGGPLGCELAQAFARLGSQVTVVSDAARLLPREDEDTSAIVEKQFRSDGIALFLSATLERAERSAVGKILIINRGRGGETLVGDQILVAAGREANIGGLGLERAGVKHDQKGVAVDDRLRTSNRNIFAAGDVASPYKFTHAAEALGRIALQNALFFGRKRASRLVIPWCTYTDPEIAHAGMYEAEARSRGLQAQTVTLASSTVDRAVIDGDAGGFCRVLAEKKSGKILGATVIGRHAGESIGELVLAIQRRMKLSELGAVVHPYPTQAEIIKRAGDAAMRQRLKPWMRAALNRIFQWRR